MKFCYFGKWYLAIILLLLTLITVEAGYQSGEDVMWKFELAGRARAECN